jgi:lipoprotein-releasing system ATP-binding protein
MPAETKSATGRRESAAVRAGASAGVLAGALIEARDLRKSYGAGGSEITVLSGVNISVQPGELIAIVGPSGSGKSTFLHLLAALDTPTSGTVYFEQKATDSFRENELADYRNRSIGFVWQRHHLLADFTAAENVAMPLLMRGAGYKEALGTSARWLREVGLGERIEHRAGELSGGEQQRVAIARALVQEPALLLADEPTGDLDERNAIAVFELMQRLHREHGLTSILATHNTVLAERADRVLQLEHGLLEPVGKDQSPEVAPEGETS